MIEVVHVCSEFRVWQLFPFLCHMQISHLLFYKVYNSILNFQLPIFKKRHMILEDVNIFLLPKAFVITIFSAINDSFSSVGLSVSFSETFCTSIVIPYSSQCRIVYCYSPAQDTFIPFELFSERFSAYSSQNKTQTKSFWNH